MNFAQCLPCFFLSVQLVRVRKFCHFLVRALACTLQPSGADRKVRSQTGCPDGWLKREGREEIFMNLVVLDGYTLNPGDNPWTPLEELGSFTVYDRTQPGDVVQRALPAEVLITNKTRLTAEILDQLPGLRCIGILATGYDVVDVAHAGRLGIPVLNVVNYGAEAVAQQTMALLLELCRWPALHDQAVRAGEWNSCPDFCFWKTPQVELSGKVMGILGFGTIGRRVGALAHAFGMQVLAASARRSGAELSASATDPGYPVRYADLGDLLKEADVLSLHCPLSEATRHIINKENLSRMKQGAFLLNLARGPLLDEEAVAEALKSGRIGGLGVDVVSTEPITRDNPLLSSPRTVITPHIAWASLPARQNIIRILADNIRAWQEGTLRSVVNAQWLAAQR